MVVWVQASSAVVVCKKAETPKGKMGVSAHLNAKHIFTKLAER